MARALFTAVRQARATVYCKRKASGWSNSVYSQRNYHKTDKSAVPTIVARAHV